MAITEKMTATQLAYKEAKRVLAVAQKAFDKADNLLSVDDPKLAKARQMLNLAIATKDAASDEYDRAWDE